MKLLLDTCTFLWLNSGLSRVSPLARGLCADRDNDLYLSVVSAWEIALKQVAGRLPLPQPAAQYLPSRREANGIASLDLSEEAVLQLPKLPPRTPASRAIPSACFGNGSGPSGNPRKTLCCKLSDEHYQNLYQ